MTASIFALYSIDGVTEYKFDRTTPDFHLPPWFATWKQEPLDVKPSGGRVYGLFKEVVWDFSQYARGISYAQYDLFKNLQTADGKIRFQTWDPHRRQWFVCTGYIDRLPTAPTQSSRHQRVFGLKISFDRVLEV